MATVGQEFVVKLSAQVDNPGMQQLLSLLDSNKMKALGVASAITAATTAVYKFIASYTKEELQLRQLATQKKKQIEQLRAEEAALKQMGMTLSDIKKDKALKSMYDDLVKFNKEMALPNMDKAMEKVNGLRLAFYKFKSAISYVIKHIGAQVLTNLEAPITRITGKLQSAANWIRDNINQIAAKIGSLITAFAKGIIGIAETFEKIMTWVGQLPSGIKAAGAAIAGVFAMLNSGPIGKLMAAITLIGDVIHDYEVYQWNKANPDYVAEHGEVPVALKSLWQMIDEGAETGDAAKYIGEKLTETLNESLQNVQIDDVSGIFGGADGNGLLGGIINWFNTNEDSLLALGRAVVSWISRAIAYVGGTVGAVSGELIDTVMGDGTVDEGLYSGDGSAGATFVAALGGFISKSIEVAQNDGSLSEAIKEGLKTSFFTSLITAIATNVVDDNGELKVDWDSAKTDLETVGKSMLGIFTRSLELVGNIGDFIIDEIAKALLGPDGTGNDLGLDSPAISNLTGALGTVFEKWGKNDTLVNGISGTVSGLLMGGNLIESVALGLGSAFAEATRESMREAIRNSDKYANDAELLAELETLPESTLQKLYDGLEEKDKANYWSSVFSNLGSAGEDLITGLWEALLAGASAAKDLGGELFTLLTNTIIQLINPEAVGSGFSDTDNSIAKGLGTSIGTAIAGGDFWLSLFAGIAGTIIDLQSKIGNGEGQYASLWEAIKGEAGEFWGKILDIWYGPLENPEELESETNKRQYEKGIASVIEPIFRGTEEVVEREGRHYKTKSGGILNWLFGFDEQEVLKVGDEWKEIGDKIHVKGALANLWEGEDGNGGIKSKLEPIWDAIKSGAQTTFDYIAEYAGALIDVLIYKIENAFQNTTLAGALRELGVISGETSTGKNLLLSENGGLMTLEQAVNSGMGIIEIVEGQKRFANDETMQMLYKNGLIDTSGYGAGLSGDTYGSFLSGYYNAKTPEARQKVIESYLGFVEDSAGKTETEKETLYNERTTESVQIPKEWRGTSRRIGSAPEVLDAAKYLYLANKFFMSENGEYDTSKVDPELFHKSQKIVTDYMHEEAGYLEGDEVSEDRLQNYLWHIDEAFDEVPEVLGSIAENAETAEAQIAELGESVREYGSWNPDSEYEFQLGGKTWRVKKDQFGTYDFEHAKWLTEDGSWSSEHNTEVVPASASGLPFDTRKDHDADMMKEAFSIGGLEFKEILDGVDMSDATGKVQELGTKAETAGGHVSKFGELAGGAEGSVQTLGDAASKAAGQLNSIKAPKFFGLFGAEGGRYDKDTQITIGEDGTEYLIPITKPGRAFQLIGQMLSEMGSSAIKHVMGMFGFSKDESSSSLFGAEGGRSNNFDMASRLINSLLDGLGIGQSGTIGASVASMSNAMSGMVMNNTYNISAPVNINVNADGASAEDIGTTTYNLAERHLLKNLKGACA